jgi:HAD superfamily hydrolase (TIGR01458 family)
MSGMLHDVDALLLDIDGVLAVSWEPVPGSIDAMTWVRRAGIPFRLITNTTTHTRADLASVLGRAGFDVTSEEIVTAVSATASYLRSTYPGARVALLTDGDAREDLVGVGVVPLDDEPEVVVLGGACDAFSYSTVNRVFQRVMDGATLVGMHRNLYWRTSEGWQLDGGAYLTGLETAAGVSATICGKPAPAFFRAALEALDVGPDRALMVGDDVVNDIGGAQDAGIRAALVRTGKFQEADLSKGAPDLVLDSFGSLPEALEG